jgi:PIN domain nuclease of toxin-antitoxin system
MKYLLDTHIVLWLAQSPEKLSAKVKAAIFDINSRKYVSVVSAWEVALLLRTGKLKLDGGLTTFEKIVSENGFLFLPLTIEPLYPLKNLPFHHKDPFDHLLISIAIQEELTLITHDKNILQYNVSTLYC